MRAKIFGSSKSKPQSSADSASSAYSQGTSDAPVRPFRPLHFSSVRPPQSQPHRASSPRSHPSSQSLSIFNPDKRPYSSKPFAPVLSFHLRWADMSDLLHGRMGYWPQRTSAAAAGSQQKPLADRLGADQRSATPQYYQPPPDRGGPAQGIQAPAQRQPSIASNDLAQIEASNAAYAPSLPADEQAQSHRRSYLHSLASPPLLEKEQPKRGLRERIGFGGHNSKQSAEQQGGLHAKAAGVGRALSVRKKSSTSQDKLKGAIEGQTQQWVLGQNSSSQLLGQEEEEEQHNTFRVQDENQGPPVPEKDHLSHEQYYRQAPIAPQKQAQDYYPPPPEPLQRLNTNLSYHGSDVYSPAYQHPAYQQEQHHQYQSYQEQQSQQDQNEAYQQHFPPPSGPHISLYQPQVNHETGYSYTAQQEQEQSRSRHASVQNLQELQSVNTGRVSFEHPQQQHQYHSQSDSGHQPSVRTPGHQHSASQDPLFLNPPQAPALQGDHPLPPPSPLQSGPAGQPTQPPTNPQETSPSDSSSSSAAMPRESQSRSANTIRQVDSKGMAPPSSRDGLALGQPNSSQTGFAQQGAQSGQGRPLQPPSEDPGRESPAPPTELAEDDAAQYQQLKKEYKELRDKYNRVKKFYFEMEEQVHKLQNTLAHQRLSQSRTSLDDSEYAARFSRLDGLISQLAFSIRKSWKAIPDFLARVVNKDAVATGKQEMTAVGRAFISYWLVCEVFERFFHPDLELGLSMQLRQIYNNIRRFAPPFQSGEEEEALNSKLINWRLATIDGLQDRLRSAEAAEHQQRLVAHLNEKLISDISVLLQDPAPSDLAGGVHMIIELVVNKIAMHLLVESRDVMIDYFLPGTPVMSDLMKAETGIPALTSPLASDGPVDGSDAKSQQSHGTGEATEPDHASVNTASSGTADDQGAQGSGSSSRDPDTGKKRGMFSGIMSSSSSKKPSGSSTAGSSSNAKGNNGGSSAGQSGTGRETPTPEKQEQRVRMAVGICVRIRGKSVLNKAPCFCMP